MNKIINKFLFLIFGFVSVCNIASGAQQPLNPTSYDDAVASQPSAKSPDTIRTATKSVANAVAADMVKQQDMNTELYTGLSLRPLTSCFASSAALTACGMSFSWIPGDNLGTATALNISALFSGTGECLKSDGTKGDCGTSGTSYTDEQAQDATGSMVAGNTESGITVTYDDTTGKLNFSVATQSDVNFTSAKDTKLTGIATGAEVNVNADWNASSGDAQILNKPTIPTVSDTAYDATSWNGSFDAPSKNAVRDKIESLSLGGSMTWPSSAGIAVYGGSSAWGTSITPGTGIATALATAIDSAGGLLAYNTYIAQPILEFSSDFSESTVSGTTIVSLAHKLIASGTTALGTTAIASGACATVVSVTATGVTAGTPAIWGPTTRWSQVTGYAPTTSGWLRVDNYQTANTVNFEVCNYTNASITPGAVSIGWQVWQ